MFKKKKRGFPGGAVVENLPANAATRVRALVQEDPTCRGATKPVRHNYWAREPQLLSHNFSATTTEASTPRACALQQEKPPQWEAHAPQRRVALLAATRESPRVATKTQPAKK